MALSLTINSTPTTLASIGVGNIVIHRQILAPDTAEIELVPAARPDAQPMKFGDVVEVLDGTTIAFIGTVTKTPRPKLGANLERRSYLLSNVLWSLARQPYQQTWNRNASTTYYKGRVNLGRNLDDSKQTIGEAIADILDHAASLGIDVAYDSDDLDALTTYFPDEEALDVMHIEAITRILRWAPSVTVRVEYASGTPTLRFVPHADETPASTPYATFRQLEISPLDEQKISGVVLNFETTNTDNDLIYTDVTQQTAGATTGTDVLRQTIQLEGYVASEQFQEAKVVVDTTWSLSDASFWTDRIIGLQGVTSLVITPEASPPDYSAHPYILMQGPVPEWTGKTVQEYTFNATATFSFGGETFADVPIAVRVALTDANTKTYRQTISSYFRDGETAPSGLAAAILAQFANQQWDGSASIHLNPASLGYSPGQVLEIAAPTGYKWDETGALIPSASSIDGTSTISPRIESCVYSIPASGVGTAALQITFGPPRHLGARDIVNLYQATRKRIPTQWSRSEPLGSSSTASSFNAGGPVPSSTGGMLSMTPGSSVGSLPTPTADGQLLYSYSSAAAWFAAPATLALMTHDGTDPVWFEMPAYGGGVLYYDGATGFGYKDNGYIFSYLGAVEARMAIPLDDIDLGSPDAGFYGIEVGELGAVSLAAIPSMVEGLPTGDLGGELLYSNSGDADWLAKPALPAMLVHNATAPSWLLMPEAGQGLLVWDYASGPICHAGGGYAYAYSGAVSFMARIPASAIDATNSAAAGHYPAYASDGKVTWTQFPTIPTGLPSGNTGGELLWSNGTTPAWLASPASAAIMVHNGTDPSWFAMPASGGVLCYDVATGFDYADNGYIFSYLGAVEARMVIPLDDIDLGSPDAGFYGIEIGELGEVSLAAIPDPEDELPTPTANGQLLYSYAGAPKWLSAPTGEVTGLLWWEYGYGPVWVTDATGGYPFVSKDGIAFDAKIPATNIDATNPEAAAAGYYPAYASDGKVTWTQFPTIPVGLPQAGHGELLYSLMGFPAWLSEPAGAALLTHDGTDPEWFNMPSTGGGVLCYDAATGFGYKDNGYIFSYLGAVEARMAIPLDDIYSYNDPTDGKVAHCVVLPGDPPAIEWKKIESGALNATNPPTAGYYLAAAADGLFTWTQFPSIPDGLPSGDTGGELIYSYGGTASWLAAPDGLALLAFDGTNPEWLSVPSSGAGMMVWDYATGAQMSTGVGYPYAYATGVTFSTRIPANKLSIAGDEGYYILYVDQYGSVSEIAMENLTKHAFSGTGSGRYMLSFDVNGESPALYEIGAGYV